MTAILHEMTVARDFDVFDVDFFEPRHQRKRHCARRWRTGAEYQQRGLLATLHMLVGVGGAFDAEAGRTHRTERGGNAIRVENHDDGTVAENGVAGKRVNVPKPRRHRLDHDFLGVEHAIHDDAEGFVADLRDHHEAVFGLLLGRVAELQQLAQIDQRQKLVAQPQDRGILDALDAMFLAALVAATYPHQLHHRDLRHGEALARALHDQRRYDRQRQRNLDREHSALTRHRLHVDGAADLIHVVLDHIHPDAAAGDVGNLVCGRHAGGEYEALNLRFRHLVELGLGREPRGQHLGADFCGIQPAPVIRNCDDDIAAFMPRGEPDGCAFRLAEQRAARPAIRCRDRRNCAPCG